ncbi:MAG: 50S ribosomal protein L18 [Patescibacteria group bacterium]|nr:50S ribosomal protein L18 [Patescibacteria group bacterium]
MKTNIQKAKQIKIMRRAARVRAKFLGTAKKPRLSVFKSLKHVSAQLINDEKQITIASANDAKLKGKKIENAKEVGGQIAKLALEKKIKECVFDRGRFKYHGIIKALAEGAREGGLKF